MNTLLPILKKLQDASVLVVGDVMLDIYFYGSVDRISPEAPIPVLKIQDKKDMLGGAGNVVANLSSLGAQTSIIGIVGEDSNADRIVEILQALPKATSRLIKYPKIPTITKTRFVSGTQQILRTDVEQDFEQTTSLEDAIIKEAESQIGRCGAVILSDYKKGVLSRRVCQAIISLANTRSVPVFIDPKGKDYSIYSNATLIKPNQKELRDVFSGENVKGNEIKYARKLLQDYNIQYCLLTLGKDGMILVSKNDEISFHSIKREVFDVSGAGDTVISMATSCFSVGAKIEDACTLANLAGGIVVSKSGTSSITPTEIENEISSKSKIFTAGEISALAEAWKESGYSIGFTNGCFDILHAGHIQTLTFARKNCDKLIVAINSDSSIKKLKGSDRPINNEIERILVLAELASVDAIILFEEKTPEHLIEMIKPNILVKGADYKEEEVVGYNLVKEYGGRVLLAPVLKDLSTTSIIARMQKSGN